MILRREFGGLELGRLFSTASRITIASAALAGGQLGRLGPARRRRSAAAWSARSSRWAPAWRPAGSSTSRVAQAAADRRAGADHRACCGAARCSGPAATCWASPSWPCSSASPGWGRRACGRGCCRGFAGAPAHLATAVIALALLIWVAELLGTVWLFKPVPYLVAGASVWALALGWSRAASAGWWPGRGGPRGRGRPPQHRGGMPPRRLQPGRLG